MRRRVRAPPGVPQSIVYPSKMRRKRPASRRRSAFIPRAVFGTVFAGVVPAVVGGGLGCTDTTSQTPDAQYYGVGAPCCSVAAIFEAGPDRIDGAADSPPDGVGDGTTDGAGDAAGDATEAG